MATNSGWYSKFQERLKRMVRNRAKKKRKKEEEQKEFINETVKEIREIRHNEPIVRTGGKKYKLFENEIFKKNNKVKVQNNDKRKLEGSLKEKNILGIKVKVNGTVVNKNNNEVFEYTPKKVGKRTEEKEYSYKYKEEKENKKNIDYTYVGSRQRYFVKDKGIVAKKNNIDKEKIDELGAELIIKIRTSLNDKLDKLDILESELYLLSDKQDNVLEIKKIREIKVKIDELIEEINKMIKNYNILEKNYYIDYVIDLDDKYLATDLINYREMLDDYGKEIDFVEEYKLLGEFNDLYRKLDKIKYDTEELVEKNEKKTNEFDIRDKKYEKMVKHISKIDDIHADCLYEIKKQNEYLEELAKKINEIDRKEYVTSHLRGIDALIGQTLRYLGFRMLSPFSGLIPSIAVNTLVARHMLGNIYRNLNYEDVRHVYYEAIDLGKIIGQHCNNGTCDVCEFVYSHFHSALSREMIVKQIYPLEEKYSQVCEEDNQLLKAGNAYYGFEPDRLKLLEVLLPKLVVDNIFTAMVNSQASEQGARMTSMDNATRNAKDMISNLTLKYNSIRQSAITTELTEIISGAEAL